jgi:hypothetical protein
VNIGEVDMFRSDEGIVGLMGKHIVEGRAFPLFFYGQSYLGALEPYLVAAAEALAGPTLLAVRGVPYLFSLLVVGLVWWAGAALFGRAAALTATAMMALPSVFFVEWSLKARGGFIEHVALSLVVLGLFARWAYRNAAGPGTLATLGFVAGLALWVNQLIGTTLAVMLFVLWRRRLWSRRLVTAGVAFVVGALPLLVGLARDPTGTPETLARKFFLMNRVKGSERFADDKVVHGARQRVVALAHAPGNLQTVLGGPAVAPRRREGSVLGGLASLVLLLLSGLHALRQARTSGWTGAHGLVLLLLAAVVVVGYNTARYVLVASPLAALMAGAWWAEAPPGRRRLAAGLIGAALLTNGAALASWACARPADHTSTLVETLRSAGCTRGYSAGPLYHVVFQTREAIILAALQKNRIPEYDAVVAAADRPCYVYRTDQTRKRQHRQFLAEITAAGVTFATLPAPPYYVLHDFTPRARLTAELVQRARTGRS